MRIYRTGAEERISADDPNAKAKIEARIDGLRALIGDAQNATALVQSTRKENRTNWQSLARARLRASGVDEPDIMRITELSPKGRYGVPYDEITASRSDIERLSKRLEALTARDTAPEAPEQHFGPARLVENRAANRLQIFFPSKPTESLRSSLRGHSFKWAPSSGAWQRQLTDNARSAAIRLLRREYPSSPTAPASPAPTITAASDPPMTASKKPQKQHLKAAPRLARKVAKRSAPAAALRSWLDNAPPAMVKRLSRTLERARANSQKKASLAHGKRRLEIRGTPEGFELIDSKTNAPAPYVKPSPKAKKPQRPYSAETPASLKRRVERERAKEEKARIAAELKKKREARALKLKEQRGQCAADRKKTSEANKGKGTTRRVAVAKSRESCSTALRGIEESFAAEINDLEARRPARRRAEPRERAGLSKVQRQERDDAMRGELERLDRRDLLPLWERVKASPKFRDLSFDRAQEQFAELVAEDKAAADAARDRSVADATEPGVLVCTEAQYLAKQGNPEAKAWAKDNCRGNKPKGSAASRTLSMFDGIRPLSDDDTATKATAKRETTPRGGKRARGQQTLSTRMGASVLNDAPPF